MKKLLLLLLTTFSLFMTSCVTTDDFEESNNQITGVQITILNNDNLPMRNVPVYAFSQATWEENGGELSNLEFADFVVNTDTKGIAVIEGMGSDVYFNALNNYSNVFTFVVEYEENGTVKRRVERLTMVYNMFYSLTFVV